ncbi:uncharacterized protein LOC114543840, partial [Dendronephthya gigantea]
MHWKSYKASWQAKLKEIDGIVLAGDGRHDSMGHSAKYCAYSLFCCDDPINAIIDFSLVQRNEAGSSPAMEYMAFTRSMEDVSKNDLNVNTFVSDRHSSIAKHMREKLPEITHYFDLWHLTKVSKVLSKIAKENDCEVLLPWVKPCVNHLIWSATSTADGNGQVIWAKLESSLEHVANVHKDLPNPVFNKCAHDDIEERTWLDK